MNSEYINLYVDDLRQCPPGFVVARDIDAALFYMNTYNVNILSLDHDLGMDSYGNLLPTGYDLVKIMCERGMYVNEIFLHTYNPVGKENMYKTLLASQRRGFISPYIKIYPYALHQSQYSDKD